MRPSVLARLEIIKLFRMSNFVLFFLFLTFFLPQSSTMESVARISGLFEPDLFSAYYAKVCAGALLLMALFGVNSGGKEFSEGTYRRALAMGYTKTDFYLGKLQAISIFAILILFFTFMMFMLVGLTEPNLTFSFDLAIIPFFSLAYKFFALFFAGVLGLTFIIMFRNTAFGLVFFPVLMFVEIFLNMIARIENQINSFVNYMPGTVGWHLFNTNDFDVKAISIVAFYTIFLVGLSYWRLNKQEMSPE